VIAKQFQYELLECRGAAGSVKCSLRITNRGPDRWLIHDCGERKATRAFDNFGNGSPGEACSLANKSNPDDNVYAQLISGVPIQASVLFQTVSASAASLALVNIDGGWNDNGSIIWDHFTVSFRNVPIIR
jgi:hypothetical protein